MKNYLNGKYLKENKTIEKKTVKSPAELLDA